MTKLKAVKPLTVCITTDELSDRWHVHAGTLRNWRSTGKGPRFIKIGVKVLYPLLAVEDYEIKNTKRSTVG